MIKEKITAASAEVRGVRIWDNGSRNINKFVQENRLVQRTNQHERDSGRSVPVHGAGSFPERYRFLNKRNSEKRCFQALSSSARVIGINGPSVSQAR